MIDITNKRTYYGIIATLGFLIGLNPFSIDMYLPGFTAIAISLKTDVATVGLSLASFFTGVCVGQLVYGPILDRFGRKKPLIIGLAIYCIASICCVFVTSIEQLIVLRFIQALGGCSGMVASRAFVRDIFPIQDNAKIFSMLMLVMGVAPIIAPTAGGFIVTNFDWHIIFIILAVISGLIILAVSYVLPESKANDNTVSLNPIKVTTGYLKATTNARFMLYTLAMAFSTAALFAYITSSPFVYMEFYGLSEFQYSIVFSICAFCLITGSQINRIFLRHRNEEHISLRVSVALAIITCLMLVLVTIFNPSVYVLIAFIACFMFSIGVINPNTSALAITSVSQNIGMASALGGFIQMGISAIAAAAVSVFANGTLYPMVISMLICAISSLACVMLAASSSVAAGESGETSVVNA